MADLEENAVIEPPEVTTRESVGDDVRAAWEQHSKDVAENLSNTPAESAADKAERLRDERGKFVAADKNKVEPGAAPEVTIDADRVPGKENQPSTAGDLPKTWSADAKAEWSKLPPAVQQAVLKRESEIDAGGRQWSEQKRSYEQALAPVHTLAQQYQMPHADVVARLVSVEQRLADPAQAPQVINELIHAYLTAKGIRFAPATQTNGNQQPQSPQAVQFDPNRLIQTLEQRFDQKLQAREEQQRASAEVQTILGDFGSQKDAAGNLKYEHFGDRSVKVRMGHLLENGEATSMEDAYDQAIWSLPTIRSKLTAQAAAPVNGRAQTARARSAAVSLNGAPRGAAPIPRGNGSNGSVVDDVRAAFAQHSGN